MAEDFDSIIFDLDGENLSFDVFAEDGVNFELAKKYNIDLDALEIQMVNKDADSKRKKDNDDWINLDVNLADVIDSFISCSEKPVFLIRDDRLLYANQEARLFFDLGNNEDFIGCNFFNLVEAEDRVILAESIGEMLTNSKELNIRIRSKKDCCVAAKFKAIYLPESNHFSFILFCDKTKQKKRLNYTNLYDDVTGLPNFFLFEDRVKVALSEKTLNDDNSDIVIAVINIDNKDVFDRINLGDFVKKSLAAKILFALPKSATLATGLKFGYWLMLKPKNKEDFDAQISSVLDVLNAGISDNFKTHELFFSVGVSSFSKNSQSSKKLLEQAIQALEEARNLKKNACVFFDKGEV